MQRDAGSTGRCNTFPETYDMTYIPMNERNSRSYMRAPSAGPAIAAPPINKIVLELCSEQSRGFGRVAGQAIALDIITHFAIRLRVVAPDYARLLAALVG